jgi:hypothetical protein
MKNSRTIPEVIRNNQHKLNEAPPPRAWRKLERRLDQKRMFKWSLYQQITIVVELAVVIVLFTMVTYSLQQAQSNQRKLRGNTTPLQEFNSDTPDTTALQALALTRQLQNRLAIALEEGDFSKRLTLSTPKNQTNASIPDFTWLEGSWHNPTSEHASVERWHRRNAQLLVGTGAVVVNGDTVFAEQMRLYNSGTGLVFETDFTRGQAPVRYALRQFSPERMVFENDKIAFPQQIIIERHSMDVYSILMQNENPLGLSAQQQAHLQQRNRVVQQHIIRLMERSQTQ